MKKGIFLTFEGGEGAGKTTVMNYAEKYLSVKGLLFLRTREPGGTLLGEDLRNLVLHQRKKDFFSSRAELFLYLAARSQHMEEKILPALQEGKIVLCDRFNDSSIAYQGFARNLGVKEVEKLCLFASLKIEPTATLFLNIDPEVGFSRIHKKKRGLDRLESETKEFHQKVREGYLLLAKKYPERIRCIDASLSLESVLLEVCTWLDKVLRKTFLKN